MSKQEDDSGKDIFKLLLENSKKRRKDKRRQLLEPLDVGEYFEEGSISINMETCKGVECKLCIEACPTHALYWKDGEIGIVEDLCIYCAACVWNCIVDDCIQIWRKRSSGEEERISNPKDVLKLLDKISSKKRRKRVDSLEKRDYLEKN